MCCLWLVTKKNFCLRGLCLAVQIGQYLLGVDFCLYLLGRKDLFDDSLFVYKICGAERSDGAASTSHLFAPASERLEQGGVDISNEGELQTVGIGKFFLQRFFVLAYAYHCIPCCSEFRKMGLQGSGFGGTSAGIGLGITVKDELTSGKVGAFYGIAVLVGSQNFGDTVTYIHRYGSL